MPWRELRPMDQKKEFVRELRRGLYRMTELAERYATSRKAGYALRKNGDHAIGLFQGMFERNIMTFNPGLDSNAQKLPSFTDVRELQRQLKAQGVTLVTGADERTTGPARFMAVDPHGNAILVDQHV